jgi:ubiquinone/menaquinone biosynthesis C-methylase UbiE
MAGTTESRSLKTTFNQVAEIYDQHRQKYPPELFTDLVSIAGLTSQSRVLEIGPGTGQATLPVAQLVNPHIIAVELGDNLAVITRKKLSAFPKVEIVTSNFEQWRLPDKKFDIAFAATAWHWIDPAIRVQKCAEALGKSGFLAVIETYHISGGTLEFFEQVQEIYNRFGMAKSPRDDRLPEATDISEPSLRRDFGEDLFGGLQFQRYEWDQKFTTEEYLGLLSTYSGHIAMPQDEQTAFFAGVEHLINKKFGGQVVKRFMVQLVVVKRT